LAPRLPQPYKEGTALIIPLRDFSGPGGGSVSARFIVKPSALCQQLMRELCG
jgi:hypothetical protein